MLKYLFTAHFEDGTIYEQGQDDKSINNPEKSAFFDVLELEKQSPLTRFELHGEKDIYGVPFQIMNRPDISEHLALSNIRLIYFRRITKTIFGPPVETINFNFGWQANDFTGQNIKQILILN
jgi:hypothetical protein